MAGLLLVTACGGGEGWPSDGATAPDDRGPAAVDAATRRAAQSLSVSSAAVNLEASAWGRAIQCAAAIDASTEVVRRSPIVTEAQIAEISRAGETFSAQAASLASGEGHSAEETRDRLARARREAADAPQQALRTALSCMRSTEGA